MSPARVPVVGPVYIDLLRRDFEPFPRAEPNAKRLSVGGETPQKPSFAVLKSIPCLPVNLSLMAGQVTADDNAMLPGSLPRMSILVFKLSNGHRLATGTHAYFVTFCRAFIECVHRPLVNEAFN